MSSLTMLPVSVAALSLSVIGARRRSADLQIAWRDKLSPSHDDELPESSSTAKTLSSTLSGISLGLMSWFVILLAGPNTVRNLLYGFFDSNEYSDAWGGPSLAGAWATHAAIAVAILPIYFVLLLGLVGLHTRITGVLADKTLPAWVLLILAGVVGGGAAFMRAFIHQM